MQINYPRLLADLRHLATFGQVGSGVHRLSFTPEDREARQGAESKGMNGVAHFNNPMAQFLSDSMTQLFQQRPRLLQILCIKSLGEPTVDLRQQLVSLFLLTLLLP